MNELTPEERGAQIQKKARKTVLKAMSDAGLVNLVLAEIRDAAEAEREACAKLCDSFVAERVASIDRLKNHQENDERLIWLNCKRSEAERCARKIRARGKAHGP